MANLADNIEAYLLTELARASGQIELQRVEVARQFACVPSQVTYVLATRFTVERGFYVQSRRGGGGYVRITRLLSHKRLLRDILQATEDGIAQTQALHFLGWLQREGMLSPRETAMAAAALDRSVLAVGLPERDQLRGRIFRAMMVSLMMPAEPTRSEARESGRA